MAGYTLPKDPSQRARRNKDTRQLRVLKVTPVEQPALPPLFLPDANGRRRRVPWPAATKAWWEMWGSEPIAREFRPTDWAFLADTALIHAAVWGGKLDMAAELRLRVSKMAATIEDRLRLRITYAQADEAEHNVEEKRARSGARDRYQGLSAAN